MHPEDDLAKEVATALGWLCGPDVLWWHTVNEGKRSKAAAGLAKAMGQLAGVYDYIFIWKLLGMISPQVGLIELKAGKNGLSGPQVVFGSRAVMLGCRIAMARSLDEVIDTLAAWQVPMRKSR